MLASWDGWCASSCIARPDGDASLGVHVSVQAGRFPSISALAGDLGGGDGGGDGGWQGWFCPPLTSGRCILSFVSGQLAFGGRGSNQYCRNPNHGSTPSLSPNSIRWPNVCRGKCALCWSVLLKPFTRERCHEWHRLGGSSARLHDKVCKLIPQARYAVHVCGNSQRIAE